jgi:hypothetical protein
MEKNTFYDAGLYYTQAALKQTTAIPDRQSSQGVTRPSHHD